MNRVISYIDGFNLYFGLRAKGWRKYYWLDPAAVTKAFLKPYQQFRHCHYFTARIHTNANGQNLKRQTLWLDALATRADITSHFGYYLPKQRQCKGCGTTWISYEEKMTDVNIAAQLLVDAYEDRYDTAIIVSGDSDLTTPVKKVREHFEDKRLIVAFPPARRSSDLTKAAHGHFVIGVDKLRKNLLPDEITTSSGYMIKRPSEWY
ncbi:MAG: NYN domain-containing protein [Candidatus Thiosymbion ectosymbiont of Robbea hypermnestra]|nr:NYN domain-containing protein [Candidatus Thiosymbion ectosymbiont of Robbea hypermnestra]